MLGLQARIDVELPLELDAAVLQVAQVGNVIVRETEGNHGVRIGGADVVDDHRVAGGVGRHALVIHDLDRRLRRLDEAAHRVRLGAGEVVRGIQQGDAFDAELDAIGGEEVGDVFRPDGGHRVGHQHDVGIVLAKERRAGAGLVDQQHLVLARDRHRHRGQRRTRVGHQDVDLVLGDELVVERRRGRGVALVVVGDEFDRDLLVVGLDEHAALGVLLVDPELQALVHRHRDRGESAGGRVERADLDFCGRAGRTGGAGEDCEKCDEQCYGQLAYHDAPPN